MVKFKYTYSTDIHIYIPILYIIYILTNIVYVGKEGPFSLEWLFSPGGSRGLSGAALGCCSGPHTEETWHAAQEMSCPHWLVPSPWDHHCLSHGLLLATLASKVRCASFTLRVNRTKAFMKHFPLFCVSIGPLFSIPPASAFAEGGAPMAQCMHLL